MENLDVIGILKLGLPGLVFLLSLLSFRLLTTEQKEGAPRPLILKSIRHYMYFSFCFALLTFFAPIFERYVLAGGGGGSESKTVKLLARTSDTGLQAGEAMACEGSNYSNRFILIKDEQTKNLIQVYTKVVMPCDDSDRHIHIPREDAQNLGWQAEQTESTVSAVVASEGYKFNM